MIGLLDQIAIWYKQFYKEKVMFNEFGPIITRILLWLRRRWLLLLLFAGVPIPLFVFGELAEDGAAREHFFFDDPIPQTSLPVGRHRWPGCLG